MTDVLVKMNMSLGSSSSGGISVVFAGSAEV